MAKKIVGYIKLQVPAGQANPSPPIGPALGQRGLNIMEFCKQFNAQTQKLEAGMPVPVVITYYSDRSFTFIMRKPPVSFYLKRAAKLDKGSKEPLEEAAFEHAVTRPLELSEFELFRGRKEETMAALSSSMETRSFKAGEKIFSVGDPGDELCLIRSGQVRIVLPINEHQSRHLSTFGRGDFFGDMAFLDEETRSAGAVARTAVDLYVLPRDRFEELAAQHPRLGRQFYESLALALARRLRHADAEIRVLQEA